MNRPFAVVTGASSGVGVELAKQFAQHGYDLLITAEDGDVEHIAADLKQHGVLVYAFLADLSVYSGVESLIEQIEASGRPVDAIAINAGVGVSGDFAETNLEDEIRMIQLNVVSTVHLAKRLVQDMVERRRGRVLFTSSIASTMPAPYLSVYGATKSFVQSFALSLREELKDTGVSVTALLPGPTNTQFFARAGMEDTKAGAQDKYDNDPADVARQGFEALMAGKEQVIAASWKTKVRGVFNKVLPESLKARQHAKSAAPGSARH